MRLLFGSALALIVVALFSVGAYAQTGTLSANCIAFKEAKFTYLPKNNFKYGAQKVWIQFTNNCSVDLENLDMTGYTTKDATPQNWTYNFGVALFPIKAGAVGTSIAQYKANDATFLRMIIKKDGILLFEKIFEPKEFDKLREVMQQKSKTLPAVPVQPKNLPSLK